METFIKSNSTAERYHDGIRTDYPTMIRLWSAFNRSITAFNRKCGVIVEYPSVKSSPREPREGRLR